MATLTNNAKFSFKGVGAIIGAFSGLLYAASGVFVKLLKGRSSPAFITWTRCLSMVLSTIPLGLYNRTNFWSYHKLKYVILAVVAVDATTINVLQYYSFQLIQFSDAITIISCFPLIVAILEWMFLKRRLTCIDFLSAVTCLTGVVLCTQPSFIFGLDDDNLHIDTFGVAAAIATCFGLAVNVILIKIVSSMDVVSIQIMEFGLSLLFVTPYLIFMGEFDFKVDSIGVVYIVMNGLCSIFAVYSFAIALKLDSAFFFSLGRTSEVTGSILVDAFVFQADMNALNYIGGVLVTLGICLQPVYSLYRQHKDSYLPLEEREME